MCEAMSIEERLQIILKKIEVIENYFIISAQQQRNETKKYMRVAEMAEFTGLSKRTLYCLCSRGELTFTRVGKFTMIHTDSMMEYIETHSRLSIREKVEALTQTHI